MYQQSEKKERKRFYTDATTLMSSAIGSALIGSMISTLIAPSASPLLGTFIGGIAGAIIVNYLSKYEYEKRQRQNQ